MYTITYKTKGTSKRLCSSRWIIPIKNISMTTQLVRVKVILRTTKTASPSSAKKREKIAAKNFCTSLAWSSSANVSQRHVILELTTREFYVIRWLNKSVCAKILVQNARRETTTNIGGSSVCSLWNLSSSKSQKCMILNKMLKLYNIVYEFRELCQLLF